MSYRSIFFDPSWAHQRYYGWSVALTQTHFSVLSKTIASIVRHVVLSELPIADVVPLLTKAELFDWRSIITIKDFTISCETAEPRLKLSGRQYLLTDDANRMFNSQTFVVDLSESFDTLWDNMKADNRRVCQRAIDAGMTVSSIGASDQGIVSEFFARYRAMAHERGLRDIDERAVRQMLLDGYATLYFASDHSAVCSMALVYSAGGSSYYMYGVAGDRKNDGSGQLIQWQVIEHLKKIGQSWYDFGGVRGTQTTDGIFRFKQSFGGELVNLGSEYVCQPLLISFARRASQALKIRK